MGRFTVLVIYRSPTNDGDLELFISDLERYCDSRVRDRTYWIVGDINCCILDRRDRRRLSDIWTYCTLQGEELAGAIPVVDCTIDIEHG
ncbi:hypothetical protein J6590_068819 [Homalodisca vitripennis]|nr:hypothetical protein J6590_068819 [Homalodisca vitripennis]